MSGGFCQEHAVPPTPGVYRGGGAAPGNRILGRGVPLGSPNPVGKSAPVLIPNRCSAFSGGCRPAPAAFLSGCWWLVLVRASCVAAQASYGRSVLLLQCRPFAFPDGISPAPKQKSAGQRPGALVFPMARRSQAPRVLATSAAKSSCFFSMPSPTATRA